MNVIDLIANSPSFSHTHLPPTRPRLIHHAAIHRSCLVSVFHSVQLTQSTLPPSPFTSIFCTYLNNTAILSRPVVPA